MENYDQVGKFEDIAENSEGSTKEKMDIYGDSLEAAQNRKMVAIEEFSQNFNILGMDGVDILKKWNDTLTYIIKNASKLLQIFAVILTYTKGIKGEGLARLVQSLGTSLNSWGTQYSAIGSNNKGWFGKFANWGNGVGAGSESLKASQAHQSSMIYNAAKKQGMKMKLGDGIELDRGANFLSGMNAKQLKAWNMLDAKEQQALIKQYGQEDPLLQAANALKEAAAALKESASKSEGVDKNPDSDNGTSSNNGTATVTKNGKSTGITAHPKDSGNNQSNASSENDPEKIKENLVKGSEDAAKIQTNAAGAEANTEINAATEEANIELSAAKQKALEEAGLIGDKGYIANSGVYQTDSGMVTSMSGSKPVQKQMQKGSRLSSYKGAITAAGGMAGTMIASTVSSHVTDSNDTTESTVGTIASMAPMIGSMFGPWGLVIGGALSAIGLGFNALNKTEGELLEEAKKATEQLSEIRTDLETDQKTYNELSSDEFIFKQLIKGVDQFTGENISLSDTEWEQYQSILKKIIDSHDDLYESYNAEGDIIAKNIGGIADLGSIMNETIDQIKEKIRSDNYNIANKWEKGKYPWEKGKYLSATEMRQAIADAYETSGTGIKRLEKEVEESTVSAYINANSEKNSLTKGYGIDLVYGTLSREDEKHKDDKDWVDLTDLYDQIAKDHNAGKDHEAGDGIEVLNAATPEERRLLSKYITVTNTTNPYKIEIIPEEVTQAFQQYVVESADILEENEKKLEAEKAKQDKATRLELQKQLAQGMKHVLLGSEEFANFSENTQSFLIDKVFGNIQANPYTGKDGLDQDGGVKKDFNPMYTAYKSIAEKVVEWASDENNAGEVQFLSNYDETNSTSHEDQLRKQYLMQMITDSGADANKTRAILKGMGYTGFDKYIITEDGEWTDEVKTDGKLDLTKLEGVIQSKRERNIEQVEKRLGIKGQREMSDGTDILDNFTNSEIAELYKYSDQEEIKKIFQGKGKYQNKSAEYKMAAARYELKKIKMGDFATASEYLSVFAQKVNISTKNLKELGKALNDESNAGIFGFKQLNQIAKNFGATIEELIDNIDILGSLDIFGRTDKSLPEIFSQFELIDNVISDIKENGKVSIENLDSLLQIMPELARYVGEDTSNEELLKALENSAKFKINMYQASLSKILATSEVKFEEYVKKIGTYVPKEIQKDILNFGNLETLQKTIHTLYETNEDGTIKVSKSGNAILKNKYKDMPLLAEGYNDESWARFIAENIFNIDISQDKSQVSEELYDALKSRALSVDPNLEIKEYEDNGLMQLLDNFRVNLINNSPMVMAMNNVMGIQNQIAATKQAIALEEENRIQEISKYMANLDNAWGRGTISLESYEQSLMSVNAAMGATPEQIKEVQEKLEDLNFDKYSKQFEKGAISVQKYRDELQSLISANTMGSEDWKQFVNAYIESYSQVIEGLDKKIDFLDDDDYLGRKELIQQKIDEQGQKLAAIESAGYAQYGSQYNFDEDPAYLAAKSELMGFFKELSELLNEEYQDISSSYDKGQIGIEEYIDSLKNLMTRTDATSEQIEEWGETLEDTIIKLKETYFNEGRISGDEYRKSLSEQMKKNDMDSDDYWAFRDKYISSYDIEISQIEAAMSLLDEHDYSSRINFLMKQRLVLEQQHAAYEAAGMENSKEATENIQKQVDLKKQELDLEKQLYEYRKTSSEEVLDAYTNILQYGIDQIKNRQQEINDMYDDEISKLQSINDQKKRSIELTKLQQELENARKDKVKTYVAGIGWTYQENKAKVKEAKQNLDNYLDQRKIEDLKVAQQSSNDYFKEQIEQLENIVKYISDTKSLSSTMASLMDLKKNGIVPQNMTISDAINKITKEAVNGENSQVTSLGKQFEDYKESYLFYSDKLSEFTDNYDDRIKDLAGWAQSYKSDEEFIAKIKEDFETVVDPVSSEVATIEDKLENFLGNQSYENWVRDLSASFAQTLVAEENIKGPENVTLSDLYDQLKILERELQNAVAALQQTPSYQTTPPQTIPSERYLTTDIEYDKDIFVNKKKYLTTDGRFFFIQGKYFKYNDVVFGNGRLESGTQYYTTDDLISSGYDAGWREGDPEIDKQYAPEESKDISLMYTGNRGYNPNFKISGPYSFSDGIENGPVTYTGLAMLHGSPSSPEYVLNSDQAGTLLKNLATMTMSPYQAPKVDSYNRGEGSTVYQFTGDLNLPNVQRPDQFFNELLKQANVQFPTIKRNYL